MFFANGAFIFLKAFQQQNVIHGNWWWVMPTSAAMALGEVYVIYQVAQQGVNLLLWSAVAFGGGFGCLASMWVHRWLNGRNTRGSADTNGGAQHKET